MTDPQSDWRQTAREIHPGLSPGWMHYAAALHRRLLRRWLGRLPAGSTVLKTDLFEEAFGEACPWTDIEELGWRPMGMDVGQAVVRGAADRFSNSPGAAILATDVRHIGLADDSVDAVFSNSTLDHFETEAEIEDSLAELFRILRRGGSLLLTLDNPMNPIIGLRNAIPPSWVRGLRITPFFVGRTFGRRRCLKKLSAAGFETIASGTFMHKLRYFVLPAMRLVKSEAMQRRFADAMLRAEFLARLPTSDLTGHYIWVEARKPR